MKTSPFSSPFSSSFVLVASLLAGGPLLAGCDLPDIDVGDGDDTDGDAEGGSGDGGGGSKGFGSGRDDGASAGDGAEDDGADETGGDAGADDGAADDGAADDGAADDGVDVPVGDACTSYCEVELSCDSFYEDAATCEAECAAGADEAGACVDTHAALYACVGSLDCESFTLYWQAIELILADQDPGEFPCAQELVDFAVCLDDGSGGA